MTFSRSEEKRETARERAVRQRERKSERGRPRSVCVAVPGLCTSLLVRKRRGMCSFPV